MDLFLMLESQMALFLLIFARVSAIFSVAPVFGSRNIPVYAKAGMCLTLTYILLPLISSQSTTAVPESFWAYIFVVSKEVLLGLIFGLMCSWVFSAVEMAGHLLDMQIGFGIVNVFDPQFGQQVPLLGNFKYLLALIIFLASNGHHLLLSALFASFKILPVADWSLPVSIVPLFADLVANIFIIAIKISLPVLVTIFLTDVALGILARVMPQMNIFVVGIPGKLIVGILMLTLALPFYILLLEVVFNGLYTDLYRLLATIQGG